jgi:hypothetical protein
MIGRIVEVLRREGVALFVVRCVQRASDYRATLFFRIPAGHRSAAPDAAVEEYRPGDARDDAMPWSPEDVSARLGEGHRLFALRVNDRLVSFAWVADSTTFSINELDALVTIDRPMIWLWDCVTPDPFRGRGYYPRLLQALIARFEVDRTVIYSFPKNYPSIRGIQKAGFAPWMSVATTRWWIHMRQDGDFPGTLRVERRAS